MKVTEDAKKIYPFMINNYKKEEQIMFGEKKKRSFIIMDGSDKNYVKEVRSLCEMFIGQSWIINTLFGRIKVRRLDRNHPTMKVVTIKSGYRPWSELRKLLEQDHAGQCVFDAPL